MMRMPFWFGLNKSEFGLNGSDIVICYPGKIR